MPNSTNTLQPPPRNPKPSSSKQKEPTKEPKSKDIKDRVNDLVEKGYRLSGTTEPSHTEDTGASISVKFQDNVERLMKFNSGLNYANKVQQEDVGTPSGLARSSTTGMLDEPRESLGRKKKGKQLAEARKK